jgi:hypothetical protein
MDSEIRMRRAVGLVRVVSAGSAGRSFACSSRLCSRLLLTLVAALVLPASPALATYIPGLGDIPNGYYYTRDMDPVKVTLLSNPRDKATSRQLAEFEMPRAYIYLSSFHSEKDFPTLPSHIETNKIYIALTYPDGLPYSVALHQVEKRIASEWRQGNLRQAPAAKQLRPLLMTAEIMGSVPNAYDSAIFHPRSYQHYLGGYETLRRYSTLGISELYFGKPDDLIRKIRCPRSLDQANPKHLCEYYIVLSSNVVAKVAFVDFRVHGGLAFAEERIRAFKAVICRYIPCD